MSTTVPVALSEIKQLVKTAKRNRINRAYYKHKFKIDADQRESGIIPSEEKSKLDRVILDDSQNESLRLLGFEQAGSYLELDLSVFSLYPDVRKPRCESRWRLAKLEFVYHHQQTQVNYRYQHETLIDYEDKKRNSGQHEQRDVYKIGAATLEVIRPFALSRLNFNGQFEVTDSKGKLVSIPAKLSVAIHSTSDKFDYKYGFSSTYLADAVHKSQTEKWNPKQLLDLALEDRIDSPVNIRGELELLDNQRHQQHDVGDTNLSLNLWGAKMKRLINAKQELASNQSSQPVESLFLWVECGHLIHLSRPVEHPNLVYGMLSSPYDYASHIYSVACSVPSGSIETDIGRLASFSKLAPGVKLSLRGYKSKMYNVDLVEGVEGNGLFKVKINDFDGWGFCRTNDISDELRLAQAKLWTLNIHKTRLGQRLASESLLGGKGNSLLQLSCLLKRSQGATIAGGRNCSSIEVPRGLIVTCAAYQLWLNSSQLIASSLRELDQTRRILAARSCHLNPFSDKYLTIVQQQQMLREQCKRTNLLLNSCPLPNILKQHLYLALRKIFSDDELRDPTESAAGDEETYMGQKKFAVRSSAMGEDSLETSAAGQMKTVLDACGFESICKSIVACWASQFEPEAVTYKTQNGLLFNWPMAVVIQELIDCHSAGVAATCNPLTGNDRQLEILASLGMGENVVSGKRTDTIRVDLSGLTWDKEAERYNEQLTLGAVQNGITKLINGQVITGDSDAAVASSISCVLSDSQTMALANLLLCLAKNSSIPKREIEWGLTNCYGDESDKDKPRTQSNVSSSSYNSTLSSVSHMPSNCFRIHLFQSRPLTNLSRLNGRETISELSTGFSSPLDIISRANVGEVMPGSLSPLFLDHCMSYLELVEEDKPFTRYHTTSPGASGFFGIYGGVLGLMLSSGDCVTKFQKAKSGEEEMEAMIGTDMRESFRSEKMQRLLIEKVNPSNTMQPTGIKNLLLLEGGGSRVSSVLAKRKYNQLKLNTTLRDIDSVMEELSNPRKDKQQLADGPTVASCASLANKGTPTDANAQAVRSDILLLFDRLCSQNECLAVSWRHHIGNTLLSMAFNHICVMILAKQKAYSGAEANVLLNDFSYLIRSNEQDTESGNISQLLEDIIECLALEGRLKQAQKLTARELYAQLSSSEKKFKSSSMFRKFMAKNGHRAFKEFDYGQPTWADDPSFIIKSLQTRLKSFSLAQLEKDRQVREAKAKDRSERARQVLSRVESGRLFLEGILLKRTRNATAMREQSKSLLIRSVNKFRQAFRHLGGLLCIEGRLPDANLIFHLRMEELNQLIMQSDENRADLARLIYKARRRQQVVKPLSNLSLPRPSVGILEYIEAIDTCWQGHATTTTNQSDSSVPDLVGDNAVRGMTSCGGIVTGRAFVAKSIDEMDELQADDILLTYSIDISWSVFFYLLGGIVTEVGGIVSHGAVVAREYGIPTLCTAVGATSKFKTGQKITLDANRGICYLADGPPPLPTDVDGDTDATDAVPTTSADGDTSKSLSTSG